MSLLVSSFSYLSFSGFIFLILFSSFGNLLFEFTLLAATFVVVVVKVTFIENLVSGT